MPELNSAQFGQRYPTGLHNIPIEHLEPLRDGSSRKPERVERVKNQIAKEGGILNPLQVISNKDRGAGLLEGHHRLEAAKLLGMTHVPVHVVDSYAATASLPSHPDSNRLYREMYPHA